MTHLYFYYFYLALYRKRLVTPGLDKKASRFGKNRKNAFQPEHETIDNIYMDRTSLYLIHTKQCD